MHDAPETRDETMHHPDDDTRRAMARCEEQWLREPERDNDDGCDECAAARDDDALAAKAGAP